MNGDGDGAIREAGRKAGESQVAGGQTRKILEEGVAPGVPCWKRPSAVMWRDSAGIRSGEQKHRGVVQHRGGRGGPCESCNQEGADKQIGVG